MSRTCSVEALRARRSPAGRDPGPALRTGLWFGLVVGLLWTTEAAGAGPAPAGAPGSSAATGTAAAPDEPVPAGVSAETLLLEAKRLFQEQRYVEAGQVLDTAFTVEPRPLFLFNSGQAYRKADRPREARDQYQRFLQLAPDDRLAPEARGYIKDMDIGMPKIFMISCASDEAAQSHRADSEMIEAHLHRERGPQLDHGSQPQRGIDG